MIPPYSVVKRNLPHLDHLALYMILFQVSIYFKGAAFLRSQIISLWSSPPLAMYLESSLKEAMQTLFLCSLRVWDGFFFFKSQSMIVRSGEADISSFPSQEKSVAQTPPVWPSRTLVFLNLLRSHNLISLSWEPVTNSLAFSGLKQRVSTPSICALSS